MDYEAWAEECEHNIFLINKLIVKKTIKLKNPDISPSQKQSLLYEIGCYRRIRRECHNIAKTLRNRKEAVND